MIVVAAGLFEELTALDPGGQVGARKFEAIRVGLPGFVQCLLQVANLHSVFEGPFLSFTLFQLRIGLRERAIQVLLVQAEADEQIGAVIEGLGLGNRAVNRGSSAARRQIAPQIRLRRDCFPWFGRGRDANRYRRWSRESGSIFMVFGAAGPIVATK